MKKNFYSLRSITPKKEQDDHLSAGSTTIFPLLKIWLAAAMVAAFFLIKPAEAYADKIVYVDSSRTVSGSGTFFNNGYKTLQEAIDAANNDNSITEIWVRKGTYYPTKVPDGCTNCTARDYTFELPDNVVIYGGFKGNEPDPSYRDLAANPTILSGDIGVRGQESDNSYHVVLSVGDGETSLDGFTIRDGFMETNPSNFFASISGASIGRDVGTGAYYYNTKGTISNCIFDSQRSFATLFINHSEFLMENSVVANNPLGNGMSCIANSQTNALNCLFVGNTTNVPVGGAVHQVNSFGSFKFCTFYNNASSAGVITNENSSINLESGIIWKNDAGGPAIAHTGTGSADAAFSLIQGGYPGTGNVSTYPQFARAASPAGPDHIFRTADDGLRIVYGSPAMNTGYNQFINTPTDILGAPRVQGSEADMGAYEGAACPSYDVIYVDGGIANPGGGDSWATAVKNLSDAIAMSASCGGSKQIWVKKGTYYPSAYPAGCTNCSSARDFTFLLDKNTILYGGFAGNETTSTQRDPIHNITTLSGNIGDMNTDADNSHHVVMTLDFNNKSAILDGFTILDGRADGTGNILISTPYNTEVGKNTGAGLWLADASPVINQCVFTNNKAASGGGIYMETGYGSQTRPAISNCVFNQNQASLSGGGVYKISGDCSISNTIFTGNSATNRGGGISSPGGFVNLFNTTFYNNTASTMGGVSDFYRATNSIFWHSPIGTVFNSTPTYTTVEGGFDGVGNLADDPQFKDPANPKGPDGLWGTGDDGLKLVIGSTAMNSGNNADANTTADITGADRVQGNTIDRGAYEGGDCPPPAAFM